MSNKGWIKLHRKIQDHWIYQEKRTFSRYEAWLDLLMLANHKENKILMDNELITVKKGQLITSIRKLCDRWNWSNTKVKNFLDLLQDDSMIAYKSDTKKTVVTIDKYNVYHDEPEGKTSQKRHESISKAFQKHTNKNDKECIKNDKEEEEESAREEKNNPFKLFEENICPLSPLNIESLNQWCDDLGDDLVIAAIKLATKYNARSLAYVEDIFLEWYKNGIKTVDQARSYVSNKNRKNNTVPFRRKTKSNAESQYDDYDYGF